MYKVGALFVKNGQKFIDEVTVFTMNGACMAVNNSAKWSRKWDDSTLCNLWIRDITEEPKYHSEQYQM